MFLSNDESETFDSMSPAELISGIAENSRKASRTLASAPSSQKNDFLLLFAELLVKETTICSRKTQRMFPMPKKKVFPLPLWIA